ncbi:MAG: peptidase [Planctomycetia bacterium]|nr:peptidase [Planctomycetia bacterium]
MDRTGGIGARFAGARRRPRTGTCLVLAVATAALPATATADRVELADGRVLEGRFVLLPGVAVDPAAQAAQDRTAGTPVLMCDDELTRTMVSKRQVVKAEQGPAGTGLEQIPIPQRVPENGRRVASVGGILETTPFDEFGRRILSLSTASGRVDVVQGITRITPRWTSVEGILTEQPLLLDMRIATSSIPREVIRRVIDQHVDRGSADNRLRIVRLYLQAERYDDARQELDEVLRDFPDLADLAAERKGLAELAAARLLDEILLRGRAGQDRLAMQLLESFPADEAGGEILEAVREARDRYRDRQAGARGLMEHLRARAATLEDDGVREEVEKILAEIAGQLSFSTLDRLATFERLGTDPAMPADRGLAIAISGWLQGSSAANDNLKLALSAVRVRSLVRDYLAAEDGPDRERVHDRLKAEEAFDAATVAAVARQMRPPREPPAAVAPGLHEIEVPGLEGQERVRCLVQLPPEYDPLRKYPAIVSLHAAWSTPLNQVEWWAGMPGPDGLRRGQAARHGTIVIAPAWGREHQAAYEYSAREHAAVLASLRHAMRCFAIDSDRVFLSGHSMGGDAAWDIALAHPDLWAGLVAIVPQAGRYVHHYWRNAKTLPIYVVGGELDNACFARNSMDLDRLFSKGFDATYVEYRGRGHEHFSDEIVRIFDWMSRRRRNFFPATIDAVTMRPWDRFFWWVEMAGPPPRTVVLPAQWPPAAGVRPLAIEAKTTPGNTVAVHCGADLVRIWLSPELVDFGRPITVTLDGRRLADAVAPDTRVLLEDLRTRADRQHPFWAVVESAKTRSERSGSR